MLHPIYGTENANRRADIVFVHGLNPMGVLNADHAFKTWGMERGSVEGWPKALGDALGNVGIWLLEYDAAALGWLGNGQPMSENAKSVFLSFDAKRLGRRPTVFIAHSLGGLVVKQILNRAISIAKRDEKHIGVNTKGVAFLGTPHAGAKIASFVSILPRILRQNEALTELKEDSAACLELADWYLNVAGRHGIATRSYYETERTPAFEGLPLLKSPVLVVDKSSANPNVLDASCWPVQGANHFDLAKQGSDTELFASLQTFIEDALENPT